MARKSANFLFIISNNHDRTAPEVLRRIASPEAEFESSKNEAAVDGWTATRDGGGASAGVGSNELHRTFPYRQHHAAFRRFDGVTGSRRTDQDRSGLANSPSTGTRTFPSLAIGAPTGEPRTLNAPRPHAPRAIHHPTMRKFSQIFRIGGEFPRSGRNRFRGVQFAVPTWTSPWRAILAFVPAARSRGNQTPHTVRETKFPFSLETDAA
jgi:hypothetical protein